MTDAGDVLPSDYQIITNIKSNFVALLRSLVELGTVTNNHDKLVQVSKDLEGHLLKFENMVSRHLILARNDEDFKYKSDIPKLAATLTSNANHFIRETKYKEKRTVSHRELASEIRNFSLKLTEHEKAKGSHSKSTGEIAQRTWLKEKLSTPTKGATSTAPVVTGATSTAAPVVTHPAARAIAAAAIQDVPANLETLPIPYLIFDFLVLSDLLRLSQVCHKFKVILDDPSRWRNQSLYISTPMLIKKKDDQHDQPKLKTFPVKVNGKDDVIVKFKQELLNFIENRGSQISKYTLATPDIKDLIFILKHISTRVIQITFIFTEPVDSTDERLWSALQECQKLTHLDFKETKFSKLHVPANLKDKWNIIFPPFVHNAYACYDYVHPDSSKEFFSFKAGERFMLLPSSRDLQGWKIAMNENGEKGFVPGNYLILVDDKKK